MTTYRKMTVPCRNDLDEKCMREAEIVFEVGVFAVLRFVVNQERLYTVTHLPTGLKVHGDPWIEFDDGFAAVELAREMYATFPNAHEWTATNANGELPKRASVLEIVNRHIGPFENSTPRDGIAHNQKET